MLNPISRLQKLSAARKKRMGKLDSMIKKMKDQNEAAAKVSREIKDAKE